MTTRFNVKEHIIDASHIREFARATASAQDAVLKLHVKQYTPKDNTSPRNGDVTLIGAHANGFPKVSCKWRGYSIIITSAAGSHPRRRAGKRD
jgi:hypothetical protein